MKAIPNILTALGLALSTGIGSASGAAASACTFSGGFATLAATIPSVVGDCVSNQTYDASGNAWQDTREGRMNWHKANNVTSVVIGDAASGQVTYVNGPCGVQRRKTTQLFAFEVGQADCAIVVGVDPAPAPPGTIADGTTDAHCDWFFGAGFVHGHSPNMPTGGPTDPLNTREWLTVGPGGRVQSQYYSLTLLPWWSITHNDATPSADIGCVASEVSHAKSGARFDVYAYRGQVATWPYSVGAPTWRCDPIDGPDSVSWEGICAARKVAGWESGHGQTMWAYEHIEPSALLDGNWMRLDAIFQGPQYWVRVMSDVPATTGDIADQDALLNSFVAK